MKSNIFTGLALGMTLANARPTERTARIMAREFPQEHSHEPVLTSVNQFLQVDNPEGIQDPIFALLGNEAAAEGAGTVEDLDCLQQATADRAFTNAKAAGDVVGMTNALLYRALERNTGAVGQASVLCESVEAVNPEIAAISQHQDPASEGAAASNKEITLILAQQISSIGGDPLQAINAGTFAPGEIGDPTAAGNTCSDETDLAGCIFSQNLLVPDASAAEIDEAVAAGGDAAAAVANNATGVAAEEDPNAQAALDAEAQDAAAAKAEQEKAAAAAAEVEAKDAQAAQELEAAYAKAYAETGLKAPAQGYDFGNDACSNPSIGYGNNIGGGSGIVFAADSQQFTAVIASDDVVIVAQSICDTLEFQCGAVAIAIQQCRQAVIVIAGDNNDDDRKDEDQKKEEERQRQQDEADRKEQEQAKQDEQKQDQEQQKAEQDAQKKEQEQQQEQEAQPQEQEQQAEQEQPAVQVPSAAAEKRQNIVVVNQNNGGYRDQALAAVIFNQALGVRASNLGIDLQASQSTTVVATA